MTLDFGSVTGGVFTRLAAGTSLGCFKRERLAAIG